MSLFLKTGFFVKLNTPETKNKFYEIAAREPFEFQTGDEQTAIFSSVASGAESGYKNIDELEPDDNPPHLFQVLWGVKDGCTYYLKLASGTDRLGIDKDLDVGYITNEKSPYCDPDPLYQFWLIDNWYPAINAKNGTTNSLTPKIYFKGMKYDIDEVKDVSKLQKLRANITPYKPITIGGVTIG